MNSVYCGFKKDHYYNGTNCFVAIQVTDKQGAFISEKLYQRDLLGNEIIKSFIDNDSPRMDIISTIEQGMNNYDEKNVRTVTFLTTKVPDFKIIVIKECKSCYKVLNTSDFVIVGVQNRVQRFKTNEQKLDVDVDNYKDYLSVITIDKTDSLVVYDPIIRDRFMENNFIFNEHDFVNIIMALSYSNFASIMTLPTMK